MMTRTFAVGDKAKLLDYSGRHGDIGRVDHIGNGIVLLDLGDCIWPVDPSDLGPVATIAELAAQRDPLYAATRGGWEFDLATKSDASMYLAESRGYPFQATAYLATRDAALIGLVIRALRNQGQPYYTRGVR